MGFFLWLTAAVSMAAMPRPNTTTVTLGDGSTQTLVLGAEALPQLELLFFCHRFAILPGDCARLGLAAGIASLSHLREEAGNAAGRCGETTMPNYFYGWGSAASRHPRAGRLFGHVAGELLFQSGGLSNPGRNYPGMFLPAAGLCPDRFRFSGESFADLDAGGGGGDACGLARELLVGPMAVDKRYSTAYHGDDAAQRRWRTLVSDRLAPAFARLLLMDRASKHAWADVQEHRFFLGRFHSLRQLVASVRLDRAAWASNGYDRAAALILAMGHEAGLCVCPPAARPPPFPPPPSPPPLHTGGDNTTSSGSSRRSAVAADVVGMCAINDHVHFDLGFKILGWESFRRCCSSAGSYA